VTENEFATTGDDLISEQPRDARHRRQRRDRNLSTIFDRLVVTELATPTLARYQIITYTGSITGVFDTLTLPSGYSTDYSIPNEIDLVAPVPEPATWFAAVLVTGSVAWSQRRRLARSFSTF